MHRSSVSKILQNKILLYKQASTYLNFASKSSKGRILRALENFKGPFDTPIGRCHLRALSGANKNLKQEEYGASKPLPFINYD